MPERACECICALACGYVCAVDVRSCELNFVCLVVSGEFVRRFLCLQVTVFINISFTNAKILIIFTFYYLNDMLHIVSYLL